MKSERNTSKIGHGVSLLLRQNKLKGEQPKNIGKCYAKKHEQACKQQCKRK